MTTAEIITLIGIAVTAFTGIINLFISSRLNRRLKAYEVWIEEVHELNVKMHDRLVDVEDAINLDKRPDDVVRKRLLYNASRLYKYDETIIEEVLLLINNWTEMFSLKEKGEISPEGLTRSKSDIIEQIKKIKIKVDKVQAKISG